MPGDMCDCHWREEGGIIGVKRVEASDVVKHRTMDMGQLCKKEWPGPNANSAEMKKLWSTDNSDRKVKHSVYISMLSTPAQLQSSFMKKLIVTQITMISSGLRCCWEFDFQIIPHYAL